MADSAYDLVVIGTGSGGAPAVFRCAAAGWRVAIVDSRPYGGTCALRGCDPKKVLVGGAQLASWSRRMQGRGTEPALRIDWPALMAFKRTFTAPVPDDREEGFKEKGVNTYHGRAHFTSEETIAVDAEAGTQRLQAEHILIASGARPAPLSFEGAAHLATSTDFLEIDTLPERIVFVGGGYVSMELAHLAARAGAEVTVLHRGERPLEGFEPDLVDVLTGHTRSLGIRLCLETTVTGVERGDDAYVVHTESSDGQETYEADLVVHGAGRVPDLDDMDLAAGGVARAEDTRAEGADDGSEGSGGLKSRGVTVNEYLQSVSNPRVWAAGDAAATPGLPLTPVAAMESLVVASNLRAGPDRSQWRAPSYDGIPTVAFTGPPLAAVGLTEAEARGQGLSVAVTCDLDITGWQSYRRLRSEAAAFKVIVGEDTGRIVGAHVLGEHAGEVINLFAMAIRNGIPAADVRRGIYAYPTHGSDVPHML